MNKWQDQKQKRQLYAEIEELEMRIKQLEDEQDEHLADADKRSQAMTPDEKAEKEEEKNDLVNQKIQLYQEIQMIDERLKNERQINLSQRRYEHKHDIVRQTQELKRLQGKIKMQQAMMYGPTTRLENQSYFKADVRQRMRQQQERKQIIQNMQSFEQGSAYKKAQKIYKTGAHLLLNKAYRSGHLEQKAEEIMQTTVSLPGLADKSIDDLAVVNLQELYERGLLNFDNDNFQPMSIAQRLSQRAFKYDTKLGRTGLPQQIADLNLSADIDPPPDQQQDRQQKATTSDMDSSTRQGQQKVQIVAPAGDQYQDIQEINDLARETENQIFRQARKGYRPKSSQTMHKMRSASASVTRTRLSSAVQRPITAQSRTKLQHGPMAAGNTKRMFPRRPLSNIYKGFQSMAPEQIFKKFMDQSGQIHNDLLQQEYRESQKHRRESSEGLLKPLLMKAMHDKESKESRAEGDLSDRDSNSDALEVRGFGNELLDPSIQKHDKQDRLSSAHTAGMQNMKSKAYSKTRLQSAQSSQKFLAMNLSPYSKYQIPGGRLHFEESTSQFHQLISKRPDSSQPDQQEISSALYSRKSSHKAPLLKQTHHQQYPKIFFSRQSHADKTDIDDLPTEEFGQRASQPVPMSSEQARLHPKDMNDIFYVRQNLSEMYAKAKAQLDEQTALEESQKGRITSPITGSVDQSGQPRKSTSTHQKQSSLATEVIKKSSDQQNSELQQNSYDTQAVGSHLVEHSGKDIINISGSPAENKEAAPSEADLPSDLKLKGKTTTEKKKPPSKKTAKKKDAVKEKEELPLHKLMKVDDMKNIKYNRLVFGEKAKDSNVHEKFKAFNRNSRSFRNLSGVRVQQQQPKQVTSSYDMWMIENGLKKPKQHPSQALNQDLQVFFPGQPQTGTRFKKLEKSKLYQNQLNKQIDKLKQAKKLQDDLKKDRQDFLSGNRRASLILQDTSLGKSVHNKKKDKDKKNAMSRKTKPYYGLKSGDQFFGRLNTRAPVTQQLTQNMGELLRARKRYIWELQDVQRELEQLTEDEEEILKCKLPKREQWEIKKRIRTFFIKKGTAPPPELLFYKIGSLIGKGSFGKVNVGMHKLTRCLVAIKSINLRMQESEETCRRQAAKINKEFENMSMLQHPNVVKCYERLDTPTHTLFVMELCQGGNLLNYVRRRIRLSEDEAKYFFTKIMVGISYIHSQYIAHCDIKLENILIDNEGEVKICDFGISEKVNKEDGIIECKGITAGTRQYKAPEQLHTNQPKEDEPFQFTMIRKMRDSKKRKVYYGREVDIWAAGVTLFAMCHGYLPFQGDMDDKTLNSIERREKPDKPDWNELDHQIVFGDVLFKEKYISKPCISLITCMLEKYKTKRIKIEQVLNHPWIRENDLNTNEFQLYRREEIDFIREEFNQQRDQFNEDSDKDEDIIKSFIEQQNNKGDKQEEDKRERLVLRPPKRLNIDDERQIQEIQREYKDDYHGFNAEMRRLDIKDYGKNLFQLQSDHDFQQHTTKSSVLGPNNSTQSGLDDQEFVEAQEKEIKENTSYPYFLERRGPIDFRKVFKENKRFEELNNQDYDDGVYLGPQPTMSSCDIKDAMARRNNAVDTEDLDLKNIPDELPPDFHKQIKFDQKIIKQLEDYGYRKEYINKSLNRNELNYCNTTYHLLTKNQDYIVGQEKYDN